MAENHPTYSPMVAAFLQKRLCSFVRCVSAASAIGLGLGMANCAFAQGQIGFGQTGQTGFGQTGQTGFGQTGQNGFGQTGQNGLGLASGLTSGLSGTQAGFGANAFGSGGLSGQTSNPFGSTGMLGGATGGAAGGLGAGIGGLAGAALTNRGLQNSFGGMGGMGMGGRGGMGRGGQFNQNQNQNSNKPQIRATVKLGFEVASPSNAATTRLINDRLRRIPSTMLTGITVEMSGRTAVIRGEVNSPADGKVVERLLALEPGVDAIKNELTYANGQTPPPKPTPAAARSASSRSSSSAGTSPVQETNEIVPTPDPR